MNDHDLFTPLRDVAPAGTSRVDVARAIRDGKRRRRNGTALTVLTAVALVLGVAVLSSAVVRRPPEPAATLLDPLVQVAQVGSAGGFTPIAYRTGIRRQEITLGTADSLTPSGTVALNAAGQYPGQGGTGWIPDGERVPDVYGRAAVWTGSELLWEWSDRAWGQIRLDTADQPKERAHRVAESVTTDRATRVTMPFTVDVSGTPLRLIGTLIPLHPTDGSPALEFVAGNAVVTVSLRSDRLPSRTTPENTRVAGRPAHTTDSGIAVLTPSGEYAVEVTAGHGDDVAVVGGIAGMSALAAAVAPVPDPADRRSWTPDPLVG